MTDISDFGRRLEEKHNRERLEKVYAKCQTGERGRQIRGYVTQVACPACGLARFDDGTRCKRCGGYVQHGRDDGETMG